MTLHSVLHIMADDLRPDIEPYGTEGAHTPSLTRLSKGATVFDRVYAQQGVCGPSRNSYMSGRRPDRSRSWNFINHFREDHPDWTTLPGVFLRVGALALAAGKTYHPMLPPAYDGAKSWSASALPYRNECWNTADDTSAKFQDGGLPCVPCPIDLAKYVLKDKNVSVVNDWCEIDAYEDTLTVHQAIKTMREAKDRHFYLAVGLHKPHYPYQAAPEDFAHHPIENVRPRACLPTHACLPIPMRTY